jgi:uncharacterized protein YqgC (DUF456 family)
VPSAEEPRSKASKGRAIGCSIAVVLGILFFLAAIALPKFGGFSRESVERSKARMKAKQAAIAAQLGDAGP